MRWINASFPEFRFVLALLSSIIFAQAEKIPDILKPDALSESGLCRKTFPSPARSR